MTNAQKKEILEALRKARDIIKDAAQSKETAEWESKEVRDVFYQINEYCIMFWDR